ncbi:MAG TPA: HD domain-containing phosphohydrolase [Longimicrobiales bacterium]|nr:HD domain-containing phosphohydrolase [Longimicrobiales bacterium]
MLSGGTTASEEFGAAGAVVPLHGNARIMILDDEHAYVALLEGMLAAAGYQHVRTTMVPADALRIFPQERPDIVLLDMHMPQMDGIEVLRRLQALLPPGEFVPMLMLTGDMSSAVRKEALAAGAIDFVTKPFQVGEVLLRIRNLLQTRMLHRELRDRNGQLEARVAERTRELEQARLDILYRLARAAEFRDDATGEHTRRVGRIADRIAMALGLGEEQADEIGRAAMLHDIGKIGIPDSILLKPDALSPQEFDVIKQHTIIGRDILAGSPAPLLQKAEMIAYTHHERWDGCGYHGLSGNAIPIEGRIVAVADTFDALVNDRPYRRARSIDAAMEELSSQRGAQFDPDVLDAFVGLSFREP